MKTYLLRIAGTSEPMGMATAEDMLDLWVNVEDVYPPLSCEFLELNIGTGAVFVRDGELKISEELDMSLVNEWRTFIDLAGGSSAFTRWYNENHGVPAQQRVGVKS